LKANARRLLEIQRARIQHFEATLSKQAEELLELAGRQEASAAAQQQELSAAREQLSRKHCDEDGARQRDLAALAAERGRLAQEQAKTAAAQRQAEELLSEARDGLAEAVKRQNELRSQLAESHKLIAARTAELEALKEKQSVNAGIASELQELGESKGRLERECESLQRQLAAAMEAAASSKNTDEEAAALRKRLESAVNELRELKQQNDELLGQNKKLTNRAGGAISIAGAPPSGGFDWESQKRALMRQMEEELVNDNPEHARDRLTVEGAIRITDQVVAEKDAEIDELKKLLANQSSSLGEVAIGAAAVANLLDQDELVREERENLRRMQDEWREKLREAEVEISIERAKFARDRTELDEQLQAYQKQRAAQPSANATGADGKAPRGNWLSRLGLKDDAG
jgi:hypothetical protein